MKRAFFSCSVLSCPFATHRFKVLASSEDCSTECSRPQKVYRVPALVIGAGWAGVGVAAGLSQLAVPYIVIEKGHTEGYFWDANTYDSVRMNTFRHRLWNSPPDCEPPKDEVAYMHKAHVVDYLKCYSEHYAVSDNIEFNAEATSIQRIADNRIIQESNDTDGANGKWKVHVKDKCDGSEFDVICEYLCVATSSTRLPVVPKVFEDIYEKSGNFGCIHSAEYKNPQQIMEILSRIRRRKVKKTRILVVGCGNSAFELLGELYAHIDAETGRRQFGNDSLLLNFRNSCKGRHVIRQKNKERFERFFHAMSRPSPFSDECILKENIDSSDIGDCVKSVAFHKEVIEFDKLTEMVMLRRDLQKRGFPKPVLSPTADHFYNRKLAIVDQKNAAHWIKTGRVGVLQSDIENCQFDATTGSVLVDFKDATGDLHSECFDLVLLCTGFSHGLEQLFADESLWRSLSTDEPRYPRGLSEALAASDCEALPKRTSFRWPRTDGRSQSQVFDGLYFAAFDSGYLGGLTIGVYAMAVAEDIAVKFNKISDAQRTTFPPVTVG